MAPITMAKDQLNSNLNLGLSFSKYSMLLLNALFAISAILSISAGVSTYLSFDTFATDMGDAFRMLSIFWMVIGVTSFTVGVFGIFAALKQNVVLANLYGIAMTFMFLSQISASIADFTLMSRSRHIVSEQLDVMIKYYTHDYFGDYRPKMDWIQSKLECCGNDVPSDWKNFERSWIPENLRADLLAINSSATSTFMPASCCVPHSSYVNLTCEQYHSTGCFEPVHRIVSESIMTIGTASLFLCVLQMVGIILGFMYAGIIGRTKTQRYVQIWNSVQQGQENSATPM